jgi:hypothetical protein
MSEKKDKEKDIKEPRKKKKKKGALTKLIRFVLLKSGIVEHSKEEKEEEIKRSAIARQQIHEIFEINQQWKFVFGEEIPKKKKDLLVIKDVTPRNCWFEFEYIVSFRIHFYLCIIF